MNYIKEMSKLNVTELYLKKLGKMAYIHYFGQLKVGVSGVKSFCIVHENGSK